jgi:hypothetical protein
MRMAVIQKISKFFILVAGVSFLWIIASVIGKENLSLRQEIKRLTFSKNNVVHFPSLSDDGRWMLYLLEIKDGESSIKTLTVLNIDTGKEVELFRSGIHKAPAPFQNVTLAVGSKPPILSGNGRQAVFSLSLEEPANILDHYLGIINTDGTNLRIFSFSIDALEGKDVKSLDFTSREWERVSNYTVSRDGNRIACVLKGHLGPRRYGHPSGIIFLDTVNKKQRTILAPDFNGKEWIWSSLPRRPLTGGGWALCMSGDGSKVLFGAQSSEDINDYDLYIGNWEGLEMRRITDFHDRWFSLADMSQAGEKVIFYYNGSKKRGIGTYSCNSDGSGLEYLESKATSKIEFYDLSGNGRYLFFKHIYTVMIRDLQDGREIVAFDERTPGYASGLVPMDFPRAPAFWGPRIVSFSGDRVLLFGYPQGKTTPEIYILNLDLSE